MGVLRKVIVALAAAPAAAQLFPVRGSDSSLKFAVHDDGTCEGSGRFVAPRLEAREVLVIRDVDVLQQFEAIKATTAQAKAARDGELADVHAAAKANAAADGSLAERVTNVEAVAVLADETNQAQEAAIAKVAGDMRAALEQKQTKDDELAAATKAEVDARFTRKQDADDALATTTKAEVDAKFTAIDEQFKQKQEKDDALAATTKTDVDAKFKQKQEQDDALAATTKTEVDGKFAAIDERLKQKQEKDDELAATTKTEVDGKLPFKNLRSRTGETRAV